MKQSDRNIIFDKYNGKCAYCGCELVKGWQMAKSQVNAMGGETVSKWNNAIEKLYNDYKFEFSTEKHIELSKKLHSIKGMAMVSSYNSKLYNELYHDWIKVELPIKKNNIRSGEVQEVIWMNYDRPRFDLFGSIV